MQRVHQSVDPRQTYPNYGFKLPWWERLLGSCIAHPGRGHQGMETGIEQYRTRHDLWIDRMLIQPLPGLVSGPARDTRITVKQPFEYPQANSRAASIRTGFGSRIN